MRKGYFTFRCSHCALVQRAYSASECSCRSKPRVMRDGPLALFDLGVEELLDTTAVQAHQVVVVLALVEFEHRLARLEVAAPQQPGLLELHQHAVDGGQADVGAFGQQAP